MFATTHPDAASDLRRAMAAPCGGRDAHLRGATPAALRGGEAVDVFSEGAVIVGTVDEGRPHRILDGWACRARPHGQGDRLIFSFVLPGDLIGLHPRRRRTGTPEIVLALTKVVTRAVDRSRAAANSVTDVGLDLADAAADQEQQHLQSSILRLSKLTARQRLSHLILELEHRLRLNMMSVDGIVPVPVRKCHLANHLGLTPQHFSRSLRELEGEGVLTMRSGLVTILRRADLETTAGYASRERSWPESAVAADSARPRGD